MPSVRCYVRADDAVRCRPCDAVRIHVCTYIRPWVLAAVMSTIRSEKVSERLLAVRPSLYTIDECPLEYISLELAQTMVDMYAKGHPHVPLLPIRSSNVYLPSTPCQWMFFARTDARGETRNKQQDIDEPSAILLTFNRGNLDVSKTKKQNLRNRESQQHFVDNYCARQTTSTTNPKVPAAHLRYGSDFYLREMTR